MPDDLRAVVAELRRLESEATPDSVLYAERPEYLIGGWVYLNEHDNDFLHAMKRHLPALLDAAEHWLNAKERAERLRAIAAAMNARAWRPIESAPRDGTIIDVWLGDCDESDRNFYCTPGTRRSPCWHWKGDRFRPALGLTVGQLTTFVQPTHWQPLPPPPEDTP